MTPAEILSAMEETKRRRALIDQQRQASMGAPITGNTGLGQALTKLGTAWLLGNREQALDQQSTDLRERYATGLRGEADKYLQTQQGAPGVDLPSIGQKNVGGIAPNPRQAVLDAMVSQFPEMQAIGKQGFAEMLKKPEGQVGLKDLLPYIDPKSAIEAAVSGGRDLSGLRPKADYLTVEGQIFDKADLAGGPKVDARMRYEKPVNLNGDLYQVEARPGGKWGKLDNAPRINVSPTVINPGQKAGMEAWSKLAAADVQGLAEQARASVRMLDQLGKVEQLTKSGTFSGPTANPAIWLGQLANTMGVKLSPETQRDLTNSQTFGNVATDLWMNMMNAAGGARGLVKEESERIANNLPALLQTPEGRLSVVAHMRNVAQANIRDARAAQASYAQALRADDPSLYTFGLSETQIPRQEPVAPTPAAGPSSKPTVSNWGAR